MIRVSELNSHSDIHVFKGGIKPLWEVRVLVNVLSDLLDLTFCCRNYGLGPLQGSHCKRIVYPRMIVCYLGCFIISPLSTFQTATNFSDWIFDADYEFGIIFVL